MTSLFSHSLLNDTDRDVRGSYTAAGTARAALPSEDKTTSRQQMFNHHGKITCSRQRNGQNTKSCRLFRNISHYL